MILACLLCARSSVAQYENVWIYGQNAGLDFNGSAPVAIRSNTGLFVAGGANASVCDANGQLLFYTEGSKVWNRQHNIMPNGDNLAPVTVSSSHGPTSGTQQGTIIIPVPDNPFQYYIFSSTLGDRNIGTIGKLFYSIVDIRLRGSMGDVVAGQKAILLDSNLAGMMTAVVGQNCNIWLLTMAQNNNMTQTNKYKAFEITATGIGKEPVISDMSNILPDSQWFGNFIASSHDRSKIAAKYDIDRYQHAVFLFDFNPSSGEVSNPQRLSWVLGSSLCFSPDDTKLYYNEAILAGSSILGGRIHQFDLTAGTPNDIINSRTPIASSVFTSHMKIAPDNKMYYAYDENAGPFVHRAISVINYPNLKGNSCLPQNNVVSLLPGTILAPIVGLPNVVPVIRRDTLYSYSQQEQCDPVITLAANDTTGWNYVWNDGTAGAKLTLHMQFGKNVHWVRYQTSPCIYHVDTFEVNVIKPSYHSFTRVICTDDSFNFNERILFAPGIYHDTLKVASGCDSIVTLSLVPIPAPEIEVLVETDRTALCMGDTVLCTATGASSYQWYNNDRYIGDSNPERIYISGGRNKLVVVGRSDNDCYGTAEVVINAKSCCDMFIPNAFSPNNDGTNDEFTPIPQGRLKRYNIQIFNRWGQVVFSAFNVNNQWDGTYNGRLQDGGTYFYYITADCLDNTKLVRKGEVLLIQ